MKVNLANQQMKVFINMKNKDILYLFFSYFIIIYLRSGNMKLIETLFISNLPSLDLHGYDRDSARVKINEFINDNIKMKNKNVIIIHGVGEGIIKKETHNTLKKNKNVEEYQICYNNIGSTYVRLKIDKERKK